MGRAVFALFASSAQVLAQDGEDEATDERDAIIVTGSRLVTSEFNSAAPVQVIESEQIELEGIADITEALQQTSLASGSQQQDLSYGGFLTTGGIGASTLSIRGLGAQRTLVLLNGRRVAPAGVGGAVAPFGLNVIPQSIVSRVEILKDGASSVYGSDAVAGVVNIITERQETGGSLNIYTSQPFDEGGAQYRASKERRLQHAKSAA